jgi:hypothetical protein
MWTTHSYPGYGTAGGFAHQGYAGCPYCHPEFGAEYSVELGKQIYRSIRQWLDPGHPYRLEHMKCHFNDETENWGRPRVVTVAEQM